jgi:hypothetical protein
VADLEIGGEYGEACLGQLLSDQYDGLAHGWILKGHAAGV